MKNKIVGQEFKLSSEDIDRLSETAENVLLENKVDRKEVLRLRISMEDALLNWQKELGAKRAVYLSIFQRFGKICIELQCGGGRCNPFSNQDDMGEWAKSLRSSMETVPSYDYIKDTNTIFFQLRKPHISRVVLTLIHIVLGILVGFLGYLLPATVRSTICNHVFTPFYDIITRMFTFVGIPLIFLSVANGIQGVGNLRSFTLIGRKMVGRFFLTLLATALFSVGIGILLFQPNLNGQTVGIVEGNFLEGILKWIPSDFFQPFIDCNGIQLVLMGVVTGLLVLVLGGKSKYFSGFMLDVHVLLLELSGWFTALIPFFVFCAVVSYMWQNSLGTILLMWKPWAVTMGVEILLVLAVMLNIHRKEKVGVIQLVKKVFDTFLYALGTNSVAASIPANYACCAGDLGVDEKVYSFGIPIGTTIFKPAAAIRFIIIAMFMAISYNSMAISPEWLLRLLILGIIFSIAAPAIPSGVVMMLPTFFNQMGIRGGSGILAMLFAIDVFFDSISTAINQIIVSLSLTSYASNLKLIDKEILRKRK